MTDKKKILVVDDTAANRQRLTNLLMTHGYTVHPASDGELALEFMRTTLPDLILLDIRMPGLDGYEVCLWLKEDEANRSIPVIFVTAHDITPEWHVRMQAAFQKHTDNAVSKTVNFPRQASPEDVRQVYLMAHEQGLKGVTIYRDGSREGQVLSTGKTTEAGKEGSGGNGASWQGRVDQGLDSENQDNAGDPVAAPYWVRIDRTGNTFTGSISPDGETWTQIGDPRKVG